MDHIIPLRKLKSVLAVAVFLFLFSTITSAQSTWTGAISTDWATPGNWSTSTVPTALIDVTIPAAPAGGRMPVITTGTYNVKAITVEAGATVTQTGGTMMVNGSWRNRGTYYATAGTVEFAGNGDNTTDFASGTNDLFHVVIDPGINPQFGSIAGNKISVKGNYSNNNTGYPSQSGNFTLIFTGSGDQTYFNATSNATIGHFVVAKASGTLTAASVVKVHSLTLTSGAFTSSSNNHAITIEGNALFSNGSFNMNGSTVSVSGSWTNNGCNITGSTPTVTVSGDFIRNGGLFNLPGCSLTVGGNWTNNNSNPFIASSVTFSGSSQSIGGTVGTAFTSVIITGTARLTNSITCTALTLPGRTVNTSFDLETGATLIVNGNLTIEHPTVDARSHALNINAGTVTVIGAVNLGTGTNRNNRISSITLTNGTLNVAGNIVYNSASAVAAVIDITGAGTMNLGGNITLTNNGATLKPGTAGSTVNFNGSSAQTINVASSLRYDNITINNNAGVTPAAAITSTLVSGNITVSSGTLNNGGFSNAGASGKTFRVMNDATFNISGTAGMVTGFTKTFEPASTVNYSGGAQTVSLETYGHLTLSGSGTKTMPGSAMTIAGNFTTSGTISATAGNALTIASNVTLGAGTTFSAGSFTHQVGGNWTNNGATFNPNTSTIVLNGSTDQTLGGSVSTVTYNHLTINKTGGAVVLSINATVNGALVFTKGLIQTGSSSVIVSSTGSVSGAGQSTGWVNGNLRRTYTLTAPARTFDVGGATYYNPLTLTFSTITTGGTIEVNASATSHASIGTSGLTPVLPIVWKVTNSGNVVFTDYSIRCNWNAAQNYTGLDAATLLLGFFNASAWTNLNPSVTPTTTDLQASALKNFGDFAIGRLCIAGTWTGEVSNDWNDKLNWSCKTLPTATVNVTIPSGLARYPVISGVIVGATNNLVIQSGASLTLVDGGTLKIAAAITNNGVLDATKGTIEYNGSAAQTIPAGIFATNTVAGLTIANTSGVSLQGALDLTDVLTIKEGSLNTGGFLTLKSTETATARVAAILSTATTPIVGDVTVERYVPGRRRYRLITSSVTTSDAGTLQAGQEALSIWGNWQNSGDKTVQNLGTSITGGTAANGFDQITSNTSMFTYNSDTKKFVGFSSANGKNTKLTPLKAGVAYYMFVYGDRQNTANAAQPRPTVLKAKGKLFTGSMMLTPAAALNPLSNVVGNFTLVGNPYACTIDWKNVQKKGVSNTVWGWDPNLNNTGGFVTVTTTSTSTVVSPISSQVKMTQYIQPGQGFFVQTTALDPALQFTENSKVSGRANVNNLVFRTANQQSLMAVNLLFSNAGTPVLADGAVAAFDAAYAKEVNDEDGVKLAGNAEGLALTEGSTQLSIDSRPAPQANDTLFINLARLTKSQYTLEVFGLNLLNAVTATPFLQDTYLNTVTPLSLADTNRVVFNVVSSDPASSSANRFRIIFSENSTLPVTFVSVSANKKDQQVQIDWKVENESNAKKYEVERSGDGVAFMSVGEVPVKFNSTGNGQSYQWIDRKPAAGNNWYRVRMVETNNGQVYSKTVAVVMNAGNTSVAVAPNPVSNQQINVQLKDWQPGLVTALLYGQQGNRILKQVIDHKGGTGSYLLQPGTRLAHGIYYLKLVGKKEEHKLEVIIE